MFGVGPSGSGLDGRGDRGGGGSTVVFGSSVAVVDRVVAIVS